MQFTPKTESQLIEESLLPAGEYGFQVASADPKTSKAGNPMIVVELNIFTPDGRSHTLRDYLMESMAFKLRHFCVAVGLEKQYDSGSLEPVDIVSRSGTCRIVISPPKGDYGPQNSVKDYIKPEARGAGETAKAPPKAVQAVAEDPSIPF